MTLPPTDGRKPHKLNRFTTLPVLIDMLRRKKLVLLNPDKWEDQNDAEVMKEYKQRKNLKHLYALCLAEGDETIHHWTAFSYGSSGCCIEFDGERLLNRVRKIDGIRVGRVRYLKVKELKSESIRVSEMPFTKRWPYRCEQEFRILFESVNAADAKDGFFDIDIDLRMVRRITINQKMPAQVYETIKEYLTEVFSNPDQKIIRSTLYANKLWISKFKQGRKLSTTSASSGTVRSFVANELG
jgi:hypothetical protein